MATVNADKGINTLLLEQLVNIKDGTTGASNESPTNIDYTFGDTTIHLPGEYDYTSNNVNSGLIREINFKTGEVINTITDVECPIEDLWADAQDGKLDEVPAQIFAEEDTLNGSDEDDVLFGWAANDVIIGNKGDDELNGGDGDDDLTGGKGADEQTGGLGADVFRFLKTGDSKPNKSDRDTILDFDRAEGDIIDLAAIDAKTGGKNNAFEFIKKQGFSGDKGELRFKVKDGDALVEGDTNGDGKADFAILVEGVTKLKDADFEL